MSPHTNGRFTLPDATQVVACDVPEGVKLPDYRVLRQNRALHRLRREPELTRRQLWIVGAADRELDALLDMGAIARDHRTDTFSISPIGERLLAARGWTTYGGDER